ncbi:hypothetical protein EVAR_47978_1 [Eumeta japonica]|uniref:Uncharacterized protein n=1 Tax=Eumeta variegata TaxID=151549 RepID=A0A4C1XKJ8_EUMVA|nr:hypothetical protein EVAR_47978_1 [Eumeta japonica]
MHPRLELGIFCTESIRDSRYSTVTVKPEAKYLYTFSKFKRLIHSIQFDPIGSSPPPITSAVPTAAIRPSSRTKAIAFRRNLPEARSLSTFTEGRHALKVQSRDGEIP